MPSLFPFSSCPSVGIFGFGAFGQLIARHLAPYFSLLVHDRNADVSASAGQGNVRCADLVATAACDIVILAVPVSQMASVISDISSHLRPGAIVLDVGSVKIEPARLMRAGLPDHVDIIGTHPLFGPQSARAGIAGLKIAICPVRGQRFRRVAAFLRRTLGLNVFVVTPEEHDREAAIVQGVTHLIAKVLVRMDPLPTRMTTASFDLLVGATEMVRHDAPGVFWAIENANPHAGAVREQFFALAMEVRDQLRADQSELMPLAAV
ncbi:prephenate dehydrogenase [Thalassospira alkalitolerans]|uniref:Prephenate dehydrogenase n=1 Tax=Thalassospira alkalitolerans TaxID=1293890 RepID=A0A1Y2LDZ9_9PROT|nr:prephenate dehydrogenase [Thalassospira alkalitolerans]OSQ48809.1 prephenate dehydrogenase [Thalassospira alkalitolerans]